MAEATQDPQKSNVSSQQCCERNFIVENINYVFLFSIINIKGKYYARKRTKT
jgi:hypothetical protein